MGFINRRFISPIQARIGKLTPFHIFPDPVNLPSRNNEFITTEVELLPISKAEIIGNTKNIERSANGIRSPAATGISKMLYPTAQAMFCFIFEIVLFAINTDASKKTSNLFAIPLSVTNAEKIKAVKVPIVREALIFPLNF